MTRLLLIRHGETQWNREEIFRGRVELPLTEEGIQQAEALAASLSGEKLAAIYCSPLARTKQTAEILGRSAGLAPAPREEFIDMSYGEWEGKPLAEVQRDYPKLFASWHRTPETFRPPGGESMQEVRARAFPALQALLAVHPGQTIAVVTHRVISKILLCAVMGLGDSAFWLIRQDPACLNIVEAEEGQFVIVRLNDTCHLRGLGRDRIDF